VSRFQPLAIPCPAGFLLPLFPRKHQREPKTAGCGALNALPTKLCIDTGLSSRQGVHFKDFHRSISRYPHWDGHPEPVELSQAFDCGAAVRHTASLLNVARRSRQFNTFHIHSIVESSDLRDVGDCTTGTLFQFKFARSTRAVRCLAVGDTLPCGLPDSDVPAKVPAGANYGGVRSEKGVKSNP
jgi:hypothetical protein